ncbi:DUF302 domain-containing protein, partial [Jannaschia aquimarina]|uniref:DUF302 domain-containing protein n=1 Tax=Jannaschia aquimarina TaxID=935700 RepID=A0A0D1DE40_9RHOB
MIHISSKTAFFAALATILAFPAVGQTTATGIVRVESRHSVEATADRYEAAARERGIRVFPRFDHAEAAAEHDETLPPTVVIPFGNPGYGTPFMRQNQIAGIDFPPKALIYEDPDGQVWLA